MSANFRALFTLQFNQFCKQPKQPHQLWPLSFDSIEKMASEDMYERNRKLIESMKA